MQTSHLRSSLLLKPIFTLMEKLITKTYVTGVILTCTDESVRDARCWKTDGVVQDMGEKTVGSVFFDTNVNAEIYLNMLQDTIMLTLLNKDGEFPARRGTTSLWYLHAAMFGQQFLGSWIGHCGPMEWPLRFPDLSPLGFYLWGHLKAMVYQEKIGNMNHVKECIQNGISCKTPDVLTQVHHKWECRIHVCFQSNGNHTEHIL
jgi:hypothetical protein